MTVQNKGSGIRSSRPLPQLSVTIATASIYIQSFIQNAFTSIASSSAWINYRREWVALWLPKPISPTEVLSNIMDKTRSLMNLVSFCTFGFFQHLFLSFPIHTLVYRCQLSGLPARFSAFQNIFLPGLHDSAKVVSGLLLLLVVGFFFFLNND